jgi:hypothetical protein
VIPLRNYSITLFGVGVESTRYSYDLGKKWPTKTYDFASDFGADKSGGIIYKTGVGFKGLGLNWKYDIDINIVDMFLGKPSDPAKKPAPKLPLILSCTIPPANP